ncbi:MAG: LPS export ABC transporter periplasmic protein LptC [Armatimonadota bacterium]|nr:LPS export ABC transporter periplasmic protein LptC [Armatimonadota bacterium]
MRKLAGPAIAVAMVALIAASFIWLKEYRPFGRVEQVPSLPNVGLRLEGAELAGRSHGKKAWRFKARLVEVSRDRANTTFTDITSGTVYDNEKPVARLSARRLTYNSFTKDIAAQGRIALSANKLSVRTDLLTWSAMQRKLTCPNRVIMDMGAGKGSAESLTADLANDEMIMKKVNLTLPAEEALPRTLR